MISRRKPTDRITQLIQSGLGSDLKKLTYYRQVMVDPRAGFYNMVYRNYAVEIFENLVSYVLNDAQLYNRLRQLLLTHREEFQQESEENKRIVETNPWASTTMTTEELVKTLKKVLKCPST